MLIDIKCFGRCAAVVAAFAGFAAQASPRFTQEDRDAWTLMASISNDICRAPTDYGFSRGVNGGIDANGVLSKLAAKFASGGIRVTVKGDATQWSGMLQKDFAKAQTDRNTCASETYTTMFKAFYLNDDKTGRRIERPRDVAASYRTSVARASTQAPALPNVTEIGQQAISTQQTGGITANNIGTINESPTPRNDGSENSKCVDGNDNRLMDNKGSLPCIKGDRNDVERNLELDGPSPKTRAEDAPSNAPNTPGAGAAGSVTVHGNEDTFSSNLLAGVKVRVTGNHRFIANNEFVDANPINLELAAEHDFRMDILKEVKAKYFKLDSNSPYFVLDQQIYPSESYINKQLSELKLSWRVHRVSDWDVQMYDEKSSLPLQ
jgi:hypothetical protein